MKLFITAKQLIEQTKTSLPIMSNGNLKILHGVKAHATHIIFPEWIAHKTGMIRVCPSIEPS